MLSDFRTLLLAVALIWIVVWSYTVGSPVNEPTTQAALPLPLVTSTNEIQPIVTESESPSLNLFDVILPAPSARESFANLRRNENVPDIIIEADAVFAVTEGGTVLYEQNADASLPIASISKLLTALVALDQLPIDASVIVTADAVRTDGDSAALISGDRLSLHDALLALLVPSSNDIAVAIAQSAGSIDVFVGRMNEKATAIGLGTAQIHNPHGLAPPGNFATAREVAYLLREALRDPRLSEMLRQPHVRVVSQNQTAYEWDSTNTLLTVVPGAFGGKTGFTAESKGTLAFAFSPPAAKEERMARQGDPAVFTVVLGSRDRFSDTEAFVRWLLEAYDWQ